MKTNLISVLLIFAMLCVAQAASAAITCTTPTSTGFSTAYTGIAGAVTNATQGTVTFSCTRGLAGDATSVLLRATNGGNVTGTQNRVRLGATTSYLNYEVYKDSACSSLWSNNTVTANMIVVTLLSNLVAQPQTVSFWGCLPLGQAVPASGSYVDSLPIRVRDAANTGNLSPNGTLAVTVTAPASCAMTLAPGDVLFNYTAFGAAVNANTPFTMNCTANLPYTMSLDAYTGVVGGLIYTLNINTTPPPAGSAAVNARGTGPGQGHFIYGNMVSGQAGDCASATAAVCSTTKTSARSLTITY